MRAADPARYLQHQQREGNPGDDVADGLDRDDAPAARPLPFRHADPHRQEDEIERIGYDRGAKRAPEPVERAIEAGEPPTIAARQPQTADEREPHLDPCGIAHQGESKYSPRKVS